MRIASRLTRLLTLYSLTARHPNSVSVIRKVKNKNLTYLEKWALADLAQVTLANERKGINGVIIEAGCALGGSAIVIASAKARERPFYVYDAFGMIPPPSEKDGQDAHERYKVISSGKASGIDSGRYYGYENNLYEQVRKTFEEFGLETNTHNIKLIKGLYEDTLRVDFPVSLAHIDSDWYKSVMTCLNRIEPYLVPGGTLVIDDYFCWSGCKRAVDEYFSGKDQSKYEFKIKSRLHIVKSV